MRLKSIKLAGFKSFVDPTSVSFPTNMSAVVGPNGCGKSNIIDAVRWVMGESSAKNLRGESMTDVIFNGSSSRKPVGHASIELIFDNTDGTLGGEYASFSEIAIRRKVTRESDNTYYLNGTKCRRKDITDIFLGTGLGPRSYAIIEQGTISKLVEAKPEELRVFVEEAAGISRYKERRRDTENRIRRTRENLERLTDIRDELERQLAHLQRQAKTAERYKELKEQEREQTAQLQAVQWRELDHQAGNYNGVIRELEVAFEEQITKRVAAETGIEKLRVAHTEKTDQFNEVQSEFYGLGADIARDEQKIQHIDEREKQLRSDLVQIEESLRQAKDHMDQDEVRLVQWTQELQEIEPELELTRETEEESAVSLLSAEETMQNWQQNWDEFNQNAAAPRQQAEVQQSRIQHLEQVLKRLVERIERLDKERQEMQGEDDGDTVIILQEQLAEIDMEAEQIQEGLLTAQSSIKDERSKLDDSANSLDELRSKHQSLRGRQSSLEALQQAALEQDDASGAWLSSKQLSDKPRLADSLAVDSGWEAAVETVLGDYLQAVKVDGLSSLAQSLVDFQEGSITLYEGGSANVATSIAGGVLLAAKVGGDDTNGLLASVYAADDLDSALALRGQLQAHESVITPDGIWLGQNWLRLARDKDSQQGVLKRQQELEQLTVENKSLAEVIAELEQQRETYRETLIKAESRRDELQFTQSEIGSQQTSAAASLSALQAKLEQTLVRRQALDKELTESRSQMDQEQGNVKDARGLLQQSLDDMETDSSQREALLKIRDESRVALDTTRQKARHDKDNAHQIAMRYQSLQTQIGSSNDAKTRLQQQSAQMLERREFLAESQAENMAPLDETKASLEERLQVRIGVEDRMGEARRQLEEMDFEVRNFETSRNQAEQQAGDIRGKLEASRIELQTVTVKRKALVDELEQSDFDLEAVLALLPEDTREAQFREDLDRLANRIARLGAINLAAIDEYQSSAERKHYLDAQNEDLESAMESLENAIRKIDRETRARFKETFDEINSGLQSLFPQVFGGGEAYLELTGEDLLDTGITIMARPPGKKNSTIHLLSGGEKALTAIALVFAIFKLNPAPFCMLDEVDAPLDDANVARYARMVKAMSETVQFIFISHNKITMEYADQLMGVTMHEPGCSRLVTVDIEEAAELAAM